VGEKAFCCCELLKYTEGKAINMHKRNIQLSFNATYLDNIIGR